VRGPGASRDGKDTFVDKVIVHHELRARRRRRSAH
jgi:hypothetical protein